jgi:hypothetical protein
MIDDMIVCHECFRATIVDPTCDETQASPFGVSEAKGTWSKGIPQLRSPATGSLVGHGRRKVQPSHYGASVARFGIVCPNEQVQRISELYYQYDDGDGSASPFVGRARDDVLA